jgi:uncharacterized protein (DUF302 family)/uncharacterized membrane protein YidH (DUF202 family)
MNGPEVIVSRAGLNDYLAAERTLLAWIRTGLALMGFGFVVARFGLFLQELQSVERTLPGQHYGLSLWFGTALIAAGVLVNLFAGWQHARLLGELGRGSTPRARPAAPALAIALFLALVGLAMTVYLVSLGTAPHSDSENRQERPMAPTLKEGIVTIPSNHSVDQTIEKLRGILQAKGVTVFALVDHSGEAEKAGLKMPATKLLIFGSPKAGTPVMLAAPSIALDLPLKILVSEDAQGKTWVSYNSAEYLQRRHGVPGDLLPTLAVVGALADKAAE